MSYTKAMLVIAGLNISFGLLMVLAPDTCIALMGLHDGSESSTPTPAQLSSEAALNRLLGSFLVTLGVMAYVLQEVREIALRARILKASAVVTLLIILCSTPKELGWPPLTVSLLSLGVFLLALYKLDKGRGTHEAPETGEQESNSAHGEPALETSHPAADDSEDA